MADSENNTLDSVFRKSVMTTVVVSLEFHQLVTDFLKKYSELANLESLYLDDAISYTGELYTTDYLSLAILYQAIAESIRNYPSIVTLQDNKELLDEFSSIFLSELENSAGSVQELFSITILFMNGYRQIGFEELTIAERMVDNVYDQVELHEITDASYYFILGSFYSLVSSDLFTYQVDFIARRNLLGNLLYKFFSFIGLDRDNWFDVLVNNNIHVYLFYTIISGLNELAKMLYFHASEIPGSEYREKILQISYSVSVLVNDIMFSYLVQNFDFPEPDLSIKNFVSYFHDADEQDLVSYQMKIHLERVLASSSKLKLILSPRYSTHKDVNIALVQDLEIIETVSSVNETYELLYFLDSILLLGYYPFDEIFKKIEKECEAGGIFQSQTFEKDILGFLSDTIEYLQNSFEMTGQMDIEAYEIVILFTSEWLQIFSKNVNEYQSAIALFSAIITSGLVQIIRGYFEQNKLENAFLTYLNLFYFCELITKNIYTTPNIKFTLKEASTREEEIISKFRSMIQTWNHKTQIKTTDLKEIVIAIEISISKRTRRFVKDRQSFLGQLDQELVFKYIDMVDSLTEFLQFTESNEVNKVLEKLSDFTIYQKPKSDSIYRFERIGAVLSNSDIEELPFPLIRNVNAMAAAMTHFPIKAEFKKLMDQENIITSMDQYLNLDQFRL